ncbi:MAG: DUF481 domain-containing protein [Gammaproteobacteria bacterium HGW-Gammaproteobacteria-14]|nr:MAG: DUF481 domain-containing protein [Gammaproteobacteria bacterium HGW-Gammaproteobacteria-14]
MRKTLIAASCAAIIASPAWAEDAAETDRGWKGEVEAAYLMKRGNSRSDTVIGKANAEKDTLWWRHTAKIEGANEETRNAATGADERSAERYFLSYKLDRKFGEDSPTYLFNIATYDKDRFSGFHYQASYALGLGQRWLTGPVHTLDTEAGPGYRAVCLEPESSYSDCAAKEEDAILRLALNYGWKISETAQFSESITTEVGDDVTTTRAETSLTSQINGRLALRLSHLLKHTSEVPAGSKKSDQEVSVSIVYKF